MKYRGNDSPSAARVLDAAGSAKFYDDYAPVYEEIMPDADSSIDDKLDAAIEKIVNETCGDGMERLFSKADSSTGGANKKNSKERRTEKKSAGGSKGPHKHLGLKIFGITLAVIIGGLATTYCVFANQYTTKFIKGTIINGIDASEMTVSQVEDEIRARVENYKLNLTFRDGKTETLSKDDLGYTYVSDNGVQKLLDGQNTFKWLSGEMGETHSYTVGEATSYDADITKKSFEALPEMQSENETAPENAYLNLKADNSFEIVAEKAGNTLVEDTVLKAIGDTVTKGENSLDVTTVDGSYEVPAVTSTSSDLVAQAANLNNFLNTTVTYNTDNGDITLDRTTTIGWITKQDNGFYYIDDANLQAQVEAFVKNMAASLDYQKNTRDFNSSARGTVQLSCSSYGTTVDQATETTNLFNDLKNCITETRQPAYLEHDSVKPSDFGGTYVEVDIQNQHMYFYKNNTLIVDSACVTGLASDPERATPKGIFSIFSKERNRTLHGQQLEDGSYSYTSEVAYWMPFYNGCGLHDASWRENFGGTIYQSEGSHGCVNLPTDVAAKLYENVEVGTPVIVF